MYVYMSVYKNNKKKIIKQMTGKMVTTREPV